MQAQPSPGARVQVVQAPHLAPQAIAPGATLVPVQSAASAQAPAPEAGHANTVEPQPAVPAPVADPEMPTSVGRATDRPEVVVAAPMRNAVPAWIDARTARGDASADPAVQARRILADTLPRIAAQARADATQVLWIAAIAEYPGQDRAVVDAASMPWRSEQAYLPASSAFGQARRFHEDARTALASGREQEALDLELRAFAADPRDPDIASSLARLYLERSPAQAETARQLALHALASSGPRRAGRLDDWNTLAIASALTGHDIDAARAFLVELAISDSAERSCANAVHAFAAYGEPLRAPAEAVLYRVQRHGRVTSPACAGRLYRTVARAP